jgi:hypothetical protein
MLSEMEICNKYIIILVIIGFIFIFHLYWIKPSREDMANLDDTQKMDVKQLIYDTYKIDVTAIKNLSEIATKLQANGITLPGNMQVQGETTLKGNTILNGPIFTDHNIAHPDTKNGAIYRSDGQLTIAADNLIRFRSTTNKSNTIEMNVNDGSIVINGDLTVKGKINVKNDLTVDGKITTKKGGDFSGGRYFFTDEENCGRLRVGCAWGKPGIYAEDNKELILGSSSGTISLNNTENLTGTNNFIRYNDMINITTIGTGNLEGPDTKYLGTCGRGDCGYINVVVGPESRRNDRKFKIVKDS